MKTRDDRATNRQGKPRTMWRRRPSRGMSNEEAFGYLQPGMPRRLQVTVIVDYLGIKVKDLAEVGGVSEQTIRNWKTDRANHSPEGIDDVRAIAEIMVGAQTLSLDQVGAWFRSRNRGLDHRTPLDALVDGDYSDVVTAAESYVAFVPDLSLAELSVEAELQMQPN